MILKAIEMSKAIECYGGITTSHITKAEAATVAGDLPLRDSTPRAVLVLAVLARRARKTVSDAPQCAFNWAFFGTKAGQPRLGDVLCWLSAGGACVSIYIGKDDVTYHCLGLVENDRIGVERVIKHSYIPYVDRFTKVFSSRRMTFGLIETALSRLNPASKMKHLKQAALPTLLNVARSKPNKV